jgi:hypothetical protein
VQKLTKNAIKLAKVLLGLWVAFLLVSAATHPTGAGATGAPPTAAAPTTTAHAPGIAAPKSPAPDSKIDPAAATRKAGLIGAIAVLLTIVYFGRKGRAKHRKKIEDLQKAKA